MLRLSFNKHSQILKKLGKQYREPMARGITAELGDSAFEI